uniref:Peptidase C83 domain-containing protein n=1 Tax=Peronospora matthiolae TaxID=2874970 RepID=A0AAV1TT19_9STRA
MQLNALQIEPGRMWKGPWSWFSEDLFDCCVSHLVAKEKDNCMLGFVSSATASSEIVVLDYSRQIFAKMRRTVFAHRRVLR